MKLCQARMNQCLSACVQSLHEWSPDGSGPLHGLLLQKDTPLCAGMQLAAPVCCLSAWMSTPAVQESGRQGIAACALADGSSVTCERCGGVVARARWQHHNAWCTGR